MKVWNFMMIMLTMMVFLSFLGIQPTSAGAVLNDTGIQIVNGTLVSGDTSSSSWYSRMFNLTDGILLAFGTAVIVIGLYTRSFEWKIGLIPFFTVFAIKFISFGWSLFLLAEGEAWLEGVIATVFLPMTAMFIFSIVEWFGGSPSD